MIHRIIATVCTVLLVAMSLAVAHHWHATRALAEFQPGAPRTAPILPESAQTSAEVVKPQSPAAPMTIPTRANTSPPPSNAQEAFYTSLLQQVENLQNQNQDLLDQLAETNRELMKLEFRVDTHSSQFRPLPVTEERQDTGFDDSSGVLPPRPLLIDDPVGE